ncbi:Ribosomal protein S2, flavodoxin-like domain-containing protein, partial [Rhodotorula toruloides]
MVRAAASVARAASACTRASRAQPSRSVQTDAAAPSSPAPAPDQPTFVSRSQREHEAAYKALLEKVQQRRIQRYNAEVFEKLGSTQNRHTTFQPHHNISRPPTPVSVTASHLVAAGAHLGHSKANTHRASLPLIYGTRAGLSYIDIRQTLPALRRAAQVLKGVVERDGRVVFVGSLKGTEKAVFENAKRLGENGYGVTKWLPGTISNAREVFKWCAVPQPKVTEEEQRAYEKRRGGRPGRPLTPQKVTPLSFKPDLLVLLSPTLNEHAIREATQNEVPTIGITDTNLDPRIVTYAIPANDDSPRAVELIAGILGMAGKDGLAAKEARCVSTPSFLASTRNLPSLVSQAQAGSSGAAVPRRTAGPVERGGSRCSSSRSATRRSSSI